ncbi:MAG: hypothetical protein A3H98_13425 [Bacteroidetes bacterium RIFCSPLOWO2_02_FULL_36_8]|nr:MAG: hypothetical protein A3H98_13425 [Bacteroidetes bacterium RIFCSPLOWO2_02_FULL_36_8]OFY70185.1 MAG: hypothetical protein A3G23_08540 [Bacteroidetes bacterium RIFCSPLOWO2_12_FULL_37_12]
MLDNDRATIKLTDMKQSDIGTTTFGLTVKHDSQRKEVLFFSTAHFLFFNFMATAQNTLSFFCRHTNPMQKKMKECFLQRFTNNQETESYL